MSGRSINNWVDTDCNDDLVNKAEHEDEQRNEQEGED